MRNMARAMQTKAMSRLRFCEECCVAALHRPRHAPREPRGLTASQCGKHHRAPEGAQPRHAGTPHAGGTRAGGANVPSFPSVPRREEQPPPHSHPPSRSPEQHRDTRLPVRILTPPLFFVPFLTSDGRSGTLSGEQESNLKGPRRLRISGAGCRIFRRGGFW